MNDEGTEISLAYLDILCCALAGMLLIFFVFSLFNRQGDVSVVKGRIAAIPAASVQSQEISEDEDVRLFLIDVKDCSVGAVQTDDVIVGKTSTTQVSVLVKSTESVSLPLSCPPVTQHLVVQPVRSPNMSAVQLSVQGDGTLTYDRSRWST